MRLRPRRVRLAVVAFAVVASSVVSLTPGHAAGSGQPVALGAEVGVGGTAAEEEQAITDFEATTGHKLAFTRDYLFWDSPFPTSLEQWLSARGTIPMISVRPQTLAGTTISWAKVAAAQPGDAVYAQIKAWADKIKAYGSPIYLTFDHEPETEYSAPFGTNPADFIAAWRNFHQIFDAEGVTNVRWMWIMTSWAFMVGSSDPRYGWNWYPGDAYVDDIGADAYTFYTCHGNGPRPYRSLQYQVSGFLNFAAAHPTKPMWLPEFGVVENPDDPGAKAQWIADAEALFKQPAYDRFAGISYFNINVASVNCDWRVSTSPSAQTAYNALSQDPYYSGSADWTTPATHCPATPTGSTELSGNLSLEADQSGWTGLYSSNSKVTRTSVAGGSFDGSWALQLAAKAGTTGNDGVNDAKPRLVPGSPGLATTAGKTYVGSAEVRATAAGQLVRLQVRETTPAGAAVSSTTKKLTLNDTGWHAISASYTAKNTGDSIRYSLFGSFTSTSQPFLADCLSLRSTP